MIIISTFSHMTNTVFLTFFLKEIGLPCSETEREHFSSRWYYLCRYKGNIQNIWSRVTDADVIILHEQMITIHHVSKHLTGSFSLFKHIIYSKVSPPIPFGDFCFNTVFLFWPLKRVYLSDTNNSITLSCFLSSSLFLKFDLFVFALFLLHSSFHWELSF